MTHTIETPRLYLRELAPSDAPRLALVLSNPTSMAFYPHPFSRDEVDRWIQKNIRRYSIFGYGLWAVIRKSDNQLIGDCGVTIQNIGNELLPEVGFHTIPECCRMGYASEAAKAVIEYCSKEYKINTFFSYCNLENEASQKTMQKIGMALYKEYTEEGCKKIAYKTEI